MKTNPEFTDDLVAGSDPDAAMNGIAIMLGLLVFGLVLVVAPDIRHAL